MELLTKRYYYDEEELRRMVKASSERMWSYRHERTESFDCFYANDEEDLASQFYKIKFMSSHHTDLSDAEIADKMKRMSRHADFVKVLADQMMESDHYFLFDYGIDYEDTLMIGNYHHDHYKQASFTHPVDFLIKNSTEYMDFLDDAETGVQNILEDFGDFYYVFIDDRLVNSKGASDRYVWEYIVRCMKEGTLFCHKEMIDYINSLSMKRLRSDRISGML